MAYIYRHIRLDINQPFYIGVGSDDEGKYKRAHQSFSYKRNQHWHNVVNKTEYEVEIMIDDITWEEALLKEIEFIKLYGRKDLENGQLVNKTNGGEGVVGSKHPHTAEAKLKIGLAQKGKKKNIKNPRKNFLSTEKMKGRTPWNKGKKGVITGVKAGMLAGKNHPMLGKKHKPETIEKMKGRTPWNKNLKKDKT